MKKISLSLVFLGLLFSISCKKDITKPLPSLSENKMGENAVNEFNVSVRNGILVFPTRADYDKVATQPTEETESRFYAVLKTLNGFNSIGNKILQSSGPNETGIKDDFLAAILNEDLAVQIVDHIFKLDPQSQKVFALPIVNANEYPDLVAEKVSNGKIRMFSMEDDVLDWIVEPEGTIGDTGNEKSLFCTEGGIGGSFSPSSLNTEPCAAEFRRYGIYFSLKAYIQTGTVSGSNYFFDLEPVHYHVRCGNTVGPYNSYHATGQYDISIPGLKYQSYQGSKNLHAVYFRARVSYTSTGIATYSGWMIVRVNY
jgi:hypothetical protein